jgi:uncharacterized membrane protein YdcZ (DUF606 family)
MFRILGMFGLGILFLVISPGLRGSLIGNFESLGNAMDQYSPFSYVGLVLVIACILMFGLYRASQPR